MVSKLHQILKRGCQPALYGTGRAGCAGYVIITKAHKTKVSIMAKGVV